MDKTFSKLFSDHKGKFSDKWTHYLMEWDHLYLPYRSQSINLLEIGVQNGGSLEIWAKYFRNARMIVGCDINPACGQLSFTDQRISIVIGDASSEKCKKAIMQLSPAYDIIIDDGSHKSSDIISGFARYFPLLNEHGLYVIEDLHCSYWNDFEGGLYDPFSSISFLKRLVDICNHEHWMTDELRGKLLSRFINKHRIRFSETELSKIHSIEFTNSLCVIKKAPVKQNVLGQRRIAGKRELVTTGFEQYQGASIQEFYRDPIHHEAEDVFDLLDRVRLYERKIGNLSAQISTGNEQISSLNLELDLLQETNNLLATQLTTAREEVLSYATSPSWRITRPVRKLAALLRGRKNDD